MTFLDGVRPAGTAPWQAADHCDLEVGIVASPRAARIVFCLPASNAHARKPDTLNRAPLSPPVTGADGFQL